MCYNKKAVGQKLRSHKLFFGMTQKQVAEKTQLSTYFYSKLERGAAGMSLTTLGSLCHVLRFTPATLLRDSPIVSTDASLNCLIEILETYPPEILRAVKALVDASVHPSSEQ